MLSKWIRKLRDTPKYCVEGVIPGDLVTVFYDDQNGDWYYRKVEYGDVAMGVAVKHGDGITIISYRE